MNDFLLEILSEEIPASLQQAAGAQLQKRVAAQLQQARLPHGKMHFYATPRRITLAIDEIAPASEESTTERRGPRFPAPNAAIAGFARSVGIAPQALVLRETAKGSFYFAKTSSKPREAIKILAEASENAIRKFAWPKSMRWGADAQNLRWIRPIRAILAILTPKQGKPQIVPVSFGPLQSGDQTVGHQTHAPKPFQVQSFPQYQTALYAAKVILDHKQRRQAIRQTLADCCRKANICLIEDEALLEEIVGLVEWPVALAGKLGKVAEQIPPRILRHVLRSHQKYYCAYTKNPDHITHFIAIANLDNAKAAAAITAGYGKVATARLADAQHFLQMDREIPLAQHNEALADMVFAPALGAQKARVGRLKLLAGKIARRLKVEQKQAQYAASLAKADLTTQMVREFPQLQGFIGGYYAHQQGEAQAIAQAIAHQYHPQGLEQTVPTAPLCVVLALADKIDWLAGFWAVGEKPTSSADPLGMRRATLGVIRIIAENAGMFKFFPLPDVFAEALVILEKDLGKLPARKEICDDLLGFFRHRLVVYLRETQEFAADQIEAVLATTPAGNISVLLAKLSALRVFGQSVEAAPLFGAYRRAVNILRAEEKKEQCQYDGVVDDGVVGKQYLVAREEKNLAQILARIHEKAPCLLDKGDFVGYLKLLSGLRVPLDDFFLHILVNDENPDLRRNRLNLLACLRNFCHEIADFSLLSSKSPSA